ncbi:MAG TPA: DUF3341 domain-containing protein [Syntrophobacteraceae bacterium]|nr:DUF3341 domain-containing protein [Syntrophobacteraceae bacterium]
MIAHTDGSHTQHDRKMVEVMTIRDLHKAFEFCILLGVLTNLAGMLLLARLPQPRLPAYYDPRFTEDRFAVVVPYVVGEKGRILSILQRSGMTEIREVEGLRSHESPGVQPGHAPEFFSLLLQLPGNSLGRLGSLEPGDCGPGHVCGQPDRHRQHLRFSGAFSPKEPKGLPKEP